MEADAGVQQEQQHHELAPQLQFPPGYHFVPTELELLGYLRGKIEGQEQPLAVVNEVAILDWQPGSLVEAYKGYGESKWYFFTVREPSSSNKEEEPNRKVRVPGVKATWKATGSVAPIAAARASSKQQGEGGELAADDDEEGEEVIVGTKRVLIYQSSDPEEDGKWSMHEYILKGHAKIGQYALCSIQRKQHSDTVVDNAGEGTSSSRKRTNATNGDPAKAKKRRAKKPFTQPEGLLQLQQLQETASVEAPMKPKSRTRRAAATKRKNKASVQDDEGQQHQEVAAAVSSVKPPLTPPQQAPPQVALQQSALLLPATPLQGYTSPIDHGMLGASGPMHEEGTHANSFQYDDDMPFLSDLDLENLMMMCNQNEQPQSFADNEFITGSHAKYQLCYKQDDPNMFGDHDQRLYPELQNFTCNNITQDNSSWNHGQLQNYQQEINGGAFGAPDQLQHTDGQSPYEQMHYSSLLPQIGHCSSDQFMGSVEGDSPASGSNGTDADLFAMGVLRDDDPLGCLGTQGGSNNPEAFQSQDEPLWSCGQQQHAAGGHGCDGPPPSRCVSEFWEV